MRPDWEDMFRQMEKWAQEMDQFMHHILTARLRTLPFNREPWHPAVNVYETPGEVVVLAELAGITPENITVTCEGNQLRVEGSRSEPCPQDCRAVHRLEIPSGDFNFSVELPVSVNAEEAEATLRDGWLEVKLPKAEKPRGVSFSLRPGQRRGAQPR